MEYPYNLMEMAQDILVVKDVSLVPSERTVFDVLKVSSENLKQRTLFVHMLMENRKGLFTIFFTVEYYSGRAFYRVMFGDIAPLFTYDEVGDHLILVDMD
jgi:hypothetical protein